MKFVFECSVDSRLAARGPEVRSTEQMAASLIVCWITVSVNWLAGEITPELLDGHLTLWKIAFECQKNFQKTCNFVKKKLPKIIIKNAIGY